MYIYAPDSSSNRLLHDKAHRDTLPSGIVFSHSTLFVPQTMRMLHSVAELKRSTDTAAHCE